MALHTAGRCFIALPCTWRFRKSGKRGEVRPVRAVSIDVQGSTDEQTDASNIEQVPLPQAFPEEESKTIATPPPITTLEDLPQEDEGAAAGFSLDLDKNQSLWLLNLVSFLYGTNTTCGLPVHVAEPLPGCVQSGFRFSQTVHHILSLPLRTDTSFEFPASPGDVSWLVHPCHYALAECRPQHDARVHAVSHSSVLANICDMKLLCICCTL